MVSIGLSSLCQYLHPPTNKEDHVKGESSFEESTHGRDVYTHRHKRETGLLSLKET